MPSTTNSSSSVRTISTRADGAWMTGSGRPVTVGAVGRHRLERDGPDGFARDQRVDQLGRAVAGHQGVEGQRLLQHGGGATWPPTSSSRSASSTMPRPRPPRSSGTAKAVQPCSTMADQSAVVDPAAGVDDRPHLRRGRPAVEQGAGAVPQGDLIVRELEIHVRTIASPWT